MQNDTASEIFIDVIFDKKHENTPKKRIQNVRKYIKNMFLLGFHTQLTW